MNKSSLLQIEATKIAWNQRTLVEVEGAAECGGRRAKSGVSKRTSDLQRQAYWYLLTCTQLSAKTQTYMFLAATRNWQTQPASSSCEYMQQRLYSLGICVLMKWISFSPMTQLAANSGHCPRVVAPEWAMSVKPMEYVPRPVLIRI